MIELTGVELKQEDLVLKDFLGDSSISKSGSSRISVCHIKLLNSSAYRWFKLDGPSCKQKDILVWIHKLAETFDSAEDIVLSSCGPVLKVALCRYGEKYEYAFELRMRPENCRFLHASFLKFKEIRTEMLKGAKTTRLQSFIENCRRIVK